MEQEITPQEDKRIARSAFKVYGFLALAVYCIALAYCYVTEHFFEMGMVAVVTVVIGGIATYSYKKL